MLFLNKKTPDMPVRSLCITTVVLQLFSVLTFLSLWNGNRSGVKKITNERDDIYTRVNVPPDRNVVQNEASKRDPLAVSCLSDSSRNLICPALFMGNSNLLNLRDINNVNNIPFECRIPELIKDCSKLKRAHEYNMKSASAEEAKFPLAFSIKLHRDPEQAEQLLRTIYKPHNVYCIYVDGKSSVIIYDIMKKIAQCFDNVFVVEERLNVIYGSFAHMQSDIQCMKLLLKSNTKWKYYINLTGQEFPLKTNLEIVEILKSLNGANDVETYNLPVFLKWRQEKRYYTSNINIVETSDKKAAFPYPLQISKGSAYGSLSREFVEFVLTDNIAGEFIKWLNDTYSPEESVWATLNTLSWAPGGYQNEVRHRYGDFLSRATIWEAEKPKCHGKFVRGVCVFTSRDLMWLVGRPELFANKFNMHSDRLVLDCLEDLLRNRTLRNDFYALDWYYYRNLPHAKLYAERSSDYFNADASQKRKEAWLKNESKSPIGTINRQKSGAEMSALPGSSMNIIYTVAA